MFGQFLGKLIGGSAGAAVVDYFAKKQALTQQLKLTKLQGQIDLEKASAQYKAEQLSSSTQLAQVQLESRGNWLRQDWVLVLFSIPLVLAFIPPMQSYVLAGFHVLDATPAWYRYAAIAIMLAIYGIRGVQSLVSKAKQ